jgi:hypothetical protein
MSRLFVFESRETMRRKDEERLSKSRARIASAFSATPGLLFSRFEIRTHSLAKLRKMARIGMRDQLHEMFLGSVHAPV